MEIKSLTEHTTTAAPKTLQPSTVQPNGQEISWADANKSKEAEQQKSITRELSHSVPSVLCYPISYSKHNRKTSLWKPADILQRTGYSFFFFLDTETVGRNTKKLKVQDLLKSAEPGKPHSTLGTSVAFGKACSSLPTCAQAHTPIKGHTHTLLHISCSLFLIKPIGFAHLFRDLWTRCSPLHSWQKIK